MTEEELGAAVDAGVLQSLNQRIKQRNETKQIIVDYIRTASEGVEWRWAQDRSDHHCLSASTVKGNLVVYFRKRNLTILGSLYRETTWRLFSVAVAKDICKRAAFADINSAQYWPV